MVLTESPALQPPMVARAISPSLHSFTTSTFGSKDISMSEDGFNACWTHDSGSAMSAKPDHNFSLRGGAIYRPPTLMQVREAQMRQRQIDEEDVKIDYGDLAQGSFDDDDGYSTSSDWDSYGTLPFTMDEYNDVVAGLEGSEDWNADQRKLHKLIYMRGLHPMMPSWWRVSFKMWGVTQPHLDDVFTPKHSKKRVAIHAYGNEVAAAKALESLFYLSQTVADYEEIGYQSKISSTVVKGIRNYIKWAMRDAGIDKSRTQLNMLVLRYSPDFRGDDDSESVDSDYAPSPVSSNEDLETTTGAGTGTRDDERGDDGLAEAQRQRRFTRAVSRDLKRRLLDMGQRWRDSLRNSKGKGYIAQPPTLYAFAVVQHIVMLASHDSGAPTNPVVVLEQVRLNDRGQWLWNALSIAIPVNMARDALCEMWDTGVVVAEHDQSESDPDL